MEQCRCIECCPSRKYLLRCYCCKGKKCEITYLYLKFFFYFLQLLFTLGLYYFDIVSDIIVLLDLEKSNSEYFSLCLVILFLPTFYALTNHKWVSPDIDSEDLRDLGCCAIIITSIEVFCSWFCTFLYNVLQLHVVVSAFMTFINFNQVDVKGEKLKYIDVRMTESLLESAPQSLFQLFLILQNVASYTYDQITIYYLSISVSVVSLVVSLVSYEVIYYNHKRIGFLMRNMRTIFTHHIIDKDNETLFIETKLNSKIGGIHMSGLKNDNLFDIRYKFLKKNTPYIGLLFLYRLTEVKSRIGLLATIGNMYDGYYIIIFLFCDFFILTMANIYKSFSYPKICEKKLEEYIEATYETNRILNQISELNDCRSKSVICCTHFYELIKVIFSPKGLLSLIKFLVKQLKSLAVFNHYFCYYIYNETFTYIESEKIKSKAIVTPKIIVENAEMKCKRQEVFKVIFKNHFMSRYLNNVCLSIFIIYNLSVNTYSDSVFLISIGSIISFILNVFLWSLIVLYTRNYLKYDYIFRPITCCNFSCCSKNCDYTCCKKKCDYKCCKKKCECKYCEKKKTNNKIENINKNKELELDDICGKKKDEIETKYPDSVII